MLYLFCHNNMVWKEDEESKGFLNNFSNSTRVKQILELYCLWPQRSICYSLFERIYPQTEGSRLHYSYFSSTPPFQCDYFSFLCGRLFFPFFSFHIPHSTQLSFLFVNRTIQKKKLSISVERQKEKEWIETWEFEPFEKALGLCIFWASLCKAHGCLFRYLCLPTNFSSTIWKHHHSSDLRDWFAYFVKSGLTKSDRITFLVFILFLIALPLAFLWLQSSWHYYKNVTPYCFAVSD